MAGMAGKGLLASLGIRGRTQLGEGRGRALLRLAEADAYGSLRLTRRGASRAIKALHEAPLPLFEAADTREGGIAPEIPDAPVQLEPSTAGREVIDDCAALGFSLRVHPVLFLRGALARRGAVRSVDLMGVRDGARVRVAGLVLVRQRRGSAKGVMFLTLEDRTGPSNIIVWPSLIDRHRRVLSTAGMMGVEGRLQREAGQVRHRRSLHRSVAGPGPRGGARGAARRGGRTRWGIAAGGLVGPLGIETKEDLNPDLLILVRVASGLRISQLLDEGHFLP